MSSFVTLIIIPYFIVSAIFGMLTFTEIYNNTYYGFGTASFSELTFVFLLGAIFGWLAFPLIALKGCIKVVIKILSNKEKLNNG